MLMIATQNMKPQMHADAPRAAVGRNQKKNRRYTRMHADEHGYY